MQEIAPHIFIETSYSGVTLGAIGWDHCLILIDSPFKAEDARAWRTNLLNLGNSSERLLINLDAHVDRTLGVRAMECTIVGNEEIAEAFRSRPLTFKAQSGESGAEWEFHDGISNTRWAPPDITFTQDLIIHWEESSIILEKWPGAGVGSICIRLPIEKIIFIGDMVTPSQPPFLAEADLPSWIDSLTKLSQPLFNDYIIVSGRGGVIRQNDVKLQLRFLQKVQQKIENLASKTTLLESIDHIIPDLLSDFNFPNQRKSQFQRRLQFGLKQNFLHHFVQNPPDPNVEPI